MYTNEYNEYEERDEKRKSGFPLKDFLLKLILIIIFVLLLMWLIPWPNNKVLTDRIFNDNIQEMKNASLLYFTQERLPVNVGDKKTITLQEMLDLKLLLPFTDKNGDACDVTGSYVTIEKLENEYLLKVNLKCGDEEDYILVHVGCYAYCTTYVCEKKDETAPTPTSTPKPTKTPNPTSNPTPPVTPPPTGEPTPPPTTVPTPPPTEEPGYRTEWEYRKDTKESCLKWNNWVELPYNPDTDDIHNSYTTEKEVETLGTRYQKVGTKTEVSYARKVTQSTSRIIGYYTEKVCTNFQYTVSGSYLYRIDSAWQDAGSVSGVGLQPQDTVDTRYINPVIKWDQCVGSCTDGPYIVWQKQTRKVTRVFQPESVSTTCTNVQEKQIPIYGSVVQSTKITRTVDLFADVYYYRYRTCASHVDASSTTTWSSYNNKDLINQGYYMTGNTRKVKI